MEKDVIAMSSQEFKKLHFVKKADERLLSQTEAARLLGISGRQFRRLIRKYRAQGESGLVHQLRGKASHRKFSEAFKNSIISIYQKDFVGYHPTFFTEKLASEHNISVSKESVRLILAHHQLWTIQKKKSKHRSKRERKKHRGELVQCDGSVHQWFEGPEGRCVLMAYIDDATSTVYAQFYAYEGTIPAMDSFRRYIQRYGIPVALYTDLHSTYRNNNKVLSIEEQLNGQKALTQFSRALDQLGVAIIPAFSPQAKGRVERGFQTLQDRLVKELKRLNITSRKDANAFLNRQFLKDHNHRFAVPPAFSVNLHREALPVSMLNKIISIQEKRSVDNDFTVRYKNRILQIHQPTIAKHVTVHEYCNGSLAIFHHDAQLNFTDVTHKFVHREQKIINFLPFNTIVDPVSLKEVTPQRAS